MNLSIKKVQEIVETIYQPTFKVFTVNSKDGIDFSKPIGYFVSLGITTSIDTLKDIRSFLSDQLKGQIEFAKISELLTTKKYGQFMNKIIKAMNEDEIYQYDSSLIPENILGETECNLELNSLKKKINESTEIEEIRSYSNRIGRLSNLVGKIGRKNEWGIKGIIYENDDYKIFYKKVNFKENDSGMYRIGIFIKFL